MIEYFIQGFRNIAAEKTRSILTLLSISIGISAVIIINFIGETGKSEINNELDNMGLNGVFISADSENPFFSERELDVIKNSEGLKSVAPIMIGKIDYFAAGTKNSGYYYGIFSSGPQIFEINILHGRNFTNEENKVGGDVCLLDKGLAQSLYKRTNVIGKELTVFKKGEKRTLKVIGVVEKSGKVLEMIAGDFIPQLIYLPEKEAKGNNLKYTSLVARIEENADFDTVSASIKNRLKESVPNNISINIESLSKQREELSAMMSIISLVLTVIGGISLMVSGLGIMTIMSVAVNERKFEIGIKKSIGATNGRIMLDFLTESFIITLIGTLAGEVFSFMLIAIFFFITDINVKINFTVIFFVTMISVIIGCIFGVYPAYKAAKLKPVDALKSE